MKCSLFENHFSDYIDGELDHKERDALRFHLSGCERCQIKIADMERTVAAVRGLATRYPSPQFDQVLRNRLDQERVREVYQPTIWRRLHGVMASLTPVLARRSVAYGIAASLIATVGLVTVLSENRPSPSMTAAMLALFVPNPVEPTPAPWDMITPKSIAPQLAPMVGLDDVDIADQGLGSQNTEEILATKDPEPIVKSASRNTSVLTIQTIESQHTSFSTGTSLKTRDQLFLSGNSASGEMMGGAFTVGPSGSRSLVPLSPTRVTRISF